MIMRILPLVVLTIVLFSACNSESPDSKTGSSVKSTSTSTSTNSDKETIAAQKKFRASIASCTIIDFVFNTGFGSASSAINNPAQIGQFANFLTENSATKTPECSFAGGAVFFSEEGEMLSEVDFSVTDDCAYARVRMDNKYTEHEISATGVDFLQQFMKIVYQVGQQGQGG